MFDVAARGAFSLEQGFIFTAMILAAATSEIIDGRFRSAASWLLAGAALSAVGVIHAYRWTAGDTAVALAWDPTSQWVIGYTLAALFVWAVPYVADVSRRSRL